MRVFAYPAEKADRKHLPGGYESYRSYKPWLRDEFLFRCVFCPVRERWYPNGHESFGVDHLKPKSVAPELSCDYENLLYVCNSCNSRKGDAWPLPDPSKSPYGLHIRIRPDGTAEHLTEVGRDLIRKLQLSRSSLNQYRRRVCEQLQRPETTSNKQFRELLAEWLGFPDDLPDLAILKPPMNAKPHSDQHSWYAVNQGRSGLTYY